MKNRRNFNLTELIILVGLLIIWIALMITFIPWSREKAKTTSCEGNLKISANVLLIYSNNNAGWICTYGPNYSAWYEQPGIVTALGRNETKKRSAITGRPETMCPDFVDSFGSGQGFGAAWFILTPDDYADDAAEHVVPWANGNSQYTKLDHIRKPADYVLLADSAYTLQEKNQTAGRQAPLFARRYGGYFPRAIALRHADQGNIAYADGHVGDTKDRMGMRMRSKINAFVDGTGRRVVTTE